VHVHSLIFKGQVIQKKISITCIVWVLGKVKKMPEKGKKKYYKYLFSFKKNIKV